MTTPDSDGRVMDAAAVSALLGDIGVPVSPVRVVDAPREVGDAVTDFACDLVVLKAGGLLHKTDARGVVTGLGTPDDAVAAAREMLDRIGPSAPPFVVQPQAAGMEMLVGLRRTPGLGALVVVGVGGTATEVHQDVSRRLAPVSRDEALRMMRELRCWPLLKGYRGSEPRDVEALCDVVVRVSELATAAPQVHEVDLNPVMVGLEGGGCLVVDARAIFGDVTPDVARAPLALDRMLSPKHVVVVGVSDDEHKVGARLFRYLVDHDFPGRLDAVHPAGGMVRGRLRLSRLRDVDGSPDLVCVAVPAAHVVEVVREAVSIGAGSVLVHSSDFAESGASGRFLQEEIAQLLSEAGIPLAGPNSMGVVCPRQRLTASISGGLEASRLAAGNVALVTGSGALGSCVATRLMGEAAGLSHWIHTGNEAGATIADYLHWLVDDDHTRVIGMLVEDLKDGPAFVEAGRAAATAGKPMFAYNMARSEKGRVAALSHTGAMVGSFEAREEVLRSAQVVSVRTLRILEDALLLSAANPVPQGPRLASVTFSGGACTIIADESERAGVVLPELSDAAIACVGEHVPQYAAVRNPLDVSFQMVTEPEAFQRALEVLVESGEFDALLVQFTTNADPYAEHTARAVAGVRATSRIPVYVSRFGAEHLAPRALEVYAAAGIPVLDAPDRAMHAIGAVMRARSLLGGSGTGGGDG